MKTTNFRIYNKTILDMNQIEEWTIDCVKGKTVPDFCLVVTVKGFDGVTITNLMNQPLILLAYDNPAQFKKVLLHELAHLRQHQQGYENEQEAKLAEKPLTKTCIFRH